MTYLKLLKLKGLTWEFCQTKRIYLKLLKLKRLIQEFCQTKRTKRDIWPSLRNMNCDNVVGYFSHNLGLSNALKVELMCAILAIEIAHDKNWDHLWIQSD